MAGFTCASDFSRRGSGPGVVEVSMHINRRRLLQAAAALPAAARLGAGTSQPFHLRPGLVAYSYRKELAAKSMTYEDIIGKLADWGIDGLDSTVYWFPDTSDGYLASLRKAAFKNGVQIYSAGVRVSLCQPTPELQAAEHEKIRKWVDVADRLGASHIRVFGGPVPKGATEAQGVAWAVEVMKRGAEYAGSRGITLGVEDDGGLTTAAGPAIEIVKQTASPWAGINADSGNLRVDGYSQFASMLPYASSVHLKTEIVGADGKKEKADWKRLLTMIGDSGYKGYVGLEYEGDDAAAKVPGLLGELRKLAGA
jgi:L-ribulose-5-phosphate 3-epimerase